MAGSAAGTRVRLWAAALGLAAGVALSAEVSLTLMKNSPSAAPIWTADAFIVVALLMLPRVWGLGVLIASAVIMAAVNLRHGTSVNLTLGFAAINSMEAVLAAWFTRLACGPTVRLTNLKRVVRLLGLAVLPAMIIGGAVAGGFYALQTGRSMVMFSVTWFAANALGLALVLPAILLARRPSHDFQRPVWEHLAIYAVLAVATMAAFANKGVPLHFLLFPVALLAAFRLGPRGTAFAMLILTVLTVGFIALTPGRGAGLNPGWSMDERIRAGQLLVTTIFLTSLATAMAVSDQARLKRLWANRSALARRAQARAQAASQAKAEFLANMSHEIRTPMNSILGFTEVLLRRDDLPADARRQLGLIDQAGASLLTVVNDILDFSKMEAGEVELAPRPCRPRELADAAVAIVAEVARAKGLALEVDFSGDVDTQILVDDLRVRQILLNLLSNAVKFTEAGHVRLGVAVRDSEPRRLRIEVVDTGVGVEPDKLDRLFKRFSQADGSVSRAFGGTGLGLAICKGLTERMGGEIGVSSAPGQGSCFWFELPVERAEDDREAADAEPGQGPHSARVLLVDDHPMNRELGATLLGLLGCEVTLAQGGDEAIAQAGAAVFDVILMDLHMPHMDGWQASKAIRALGGEAALTPIVALSADVMPETAETCRNAGMVDVAAKPIRIETLHDIVSRWAGLTRDGERRAA